MTQPPISPADQAECARLVLDWGEACVASCGDSLASQLVALARLSAAGVAVRDFAIALATKTSREIGSDHDPWDTESIAYNTCPDGCGNECCVPPVTGDDDE